MGKLPWMKLYSEIITDPKIRRLSIDERWFWIVLLCLAADNNKRGQVTVVTDTIPFTRDDFVSLCGYTVQDKINGGFDPHDMIDKALKKFILLHMIEMDSNGIITIKNFEKRQDSHLSDAERASRYRHKSKVTTVTLDVDVDLDVEEDKIKSLSGKPDGNNSSEKSAEKKQLRQEAISVIAFLNEKTGRNYHPVEANVALIMARLREGATPIQLRQVIAKKCREWSAKPEMIEYLRPATLFNRTKFAQYQGELGYQNEFGALQEAKNGLP